MDGQIQLIPGADSLLPTADLSQGSAQWKAIMPDGSYVSSDKNGTLYYCGSGDKIKLTDKKIVPADENHNCAFCDIAIDEDLAISDEIKALTLYPDTHEKAYGNSWRWINTQGECLPLCGGASRALDHAGIFFMGLTYPRSHKYTLAGFRSAYIPPQSNTKDSP